MTTALSESRVRMTSAEPVRLRPGQPVATVARSVPNGGATRPARVRLTRRGRAVVLGLLLNLAVAVVAVFAVVGSGPAADSQAATATVVVRSGDTLWGIATRAKPQADPRQTIAELRRLNHLTSASIEVGQELILPAR